MFVLNSKFDVKMTFFFKRYKKIYEFNSRTRPLITEAHFIYFRTFHYMLDWLANRCAISQHFAASIYGQPRYVSMCAQSAKATET